MCWWGQVKTFTKCHFVILSIHILLLVLREVQPTPGLWVQGVGHLPNWLAGDFWGVINKNSARVQISPLSCVSREWPVSFRCIYCSRVIWDLYLREQCLVLNVHLQRYIGCVRSYLPPAKKLQSLYKAATYLFPVITTTADTGWVYG